MIYLREQSKNSLNMRMFKGWFLFSFLSILGFYGCQKGISEDIQSADNNRVNPGASGNPAKIRLSYGDTLFNLRNQPGNFTISPVSKPNSAGFFKSIPNGLAIDSVTGVINLNQSETGLRYKIYYVAATGGAALDSVKLVISGIDYRDAIYEIARTPDAYDTAFAIYNARPELVLPCGDDDEDGDGDLDDDDNQCVFDETDLDDDGNDDIPGVIQDKLLVDIKKGTIDLEASFQAGLFGSSDPANGVNRDFTFYYRLQDASNRALNKITVRVYHFKRRGDIPQTLLDTLNFRNQIATAVNSRGTTHAAVPPVMEDVSASSSGFIISRIVNMVYYAAKPKRPPIIIIVSQ
jgi:hypothetical protein